MVHWELPFYYTALLSWKWIINNVITSIISSKNKNEGMNWIYMYIKHSLFDSLLFGLSGIFSTSTLLNLNNVLKRLYIIKWPVINYMNTARSTNKMVITLVYLPRLRLIKSHMFRIFNSMNLYINLVCTAINSTERLGVYLIDSEKV